MINPHYTQTMEGMAKIIAVDFDGTLAENDWPGIGAPIQTTIDALKEEIAAGAKVILYTNRCDERLTEAVEWCREQDIEFDAVNDNLDYIIVYFGGSNSRKPFANEYWDDRAVTMPPATLSGQNGMCSVCGYFVGEENIFRTNFCPQCGKPIYRLTPEKGEPS